MPYVDLKSATRPVAFWLNGAPMMWDVPLDTFILLREAVASLPQSEQHIQNIISPAVRKYGLKQESIVRYIKHDLKRSKTA